MTMAAAYESPRAGGLAWSKSSRIASVELLADIDQAETVWRSLENQQYFFTPFQRFDFLQPWQQKIGTREGLQPAIAVAYDRDRMPLGLFPLVLKQKWGIRTAHFMGGKHTTFNMPIWNRDFAVAASRGDLELVFAELHERSGADALLFNQQPLTWHDLPNPMALMSRQPSVNDCPLMTIAPGAPPSARVSHSLRRRLKTKERKLKGLPGYRYHLADSDADIERLLDAFFRIKPQRMADQRLPNVFGEPGVEEFIRRACLTPSAEGRRVIEIHALESDGEVLALFGGVADGHRFSMMFNTYTVSASSRYSPGLILICHIADHYAARGYQSLDLGVGPDSYKRLFCKASQPIFDSFIPLGPRGIAAATILSATGRAKRLVKRSPVLTGLAQRLVRGLR